MISFQRFLKQALWALLASFSCALAATPVQPARDSPPCSEATGRFIPNLGDPRAPDVRLLADPGVGRRRYLTIVMARYQGRTVVVFAPYGPNQHIEAVRFLSAKHLNPLLQSERLPEIRVERDPKSGEIRFQGLSKGQSIEPGPSRVEFTLMGEVEVVSENGQGKIGRISDVSGLSVTLKGHDSHFKNSVNDAVPVLQRAGLLAADFKPVVFDVKSKKSQHLDDRLNQLTTREALHLFPNLIQRVSSKAEVLSGILKQSTDGEIPPENWQLLWNLAVPRDGNEPTLNILIPTLEVFAENGLIDAAKTQRSLQLFQRIRSNEKLTREELDELGKLMYQIAREANASRDVYEIVELDGTASAPEPARKR